MEGGVISADISSCRSILEENSGQALKAGACRQEVKQRPPRGTSSASLPALSCIHPRAICPKNSTSHSGLALLHQSVTKTIPHRYRHKSDLDGPSVEISSQVMLSCVKLSTKTNQDSTGPQL